MIKGGLSVDVGFQIIDPSGYECNGRAVDESMAVAGNRHAARNGGEGIRRKPQNHGMSSCVAHHRKHEVTGLMGQFTHRRGLGSG